MTKDKSENALFVQRFVAFIIDILIISLVASIITSPFLDNEALAKLNESSNDVVEKYLNQEIDSKVYINESMNITYQIARKNGIMSIPALKVYKNSELINQTVGYLELEELETLIK